MSAAADSAPRDGDAGAAAAADTPAAAPAAAAPPPAPLLCLPGPAFWFIHAAGELVVGGVPLFIHQEGGQARVCECTRTRLVVHLPSLARAES
jgi:hypothetical protein